MPSEKRLEDGVPSQESLKAGSSHGDLAASADFRSLQDRSIAAWSTLNYVGQAREEAIDKHTEAVRSLASLEDLLDNREYWFFQLRDSFLKQDRMLKWDPNGLDRYILLPVDYGFANNQDCFFVSHFWRERYHPDPDGVDLRLFHEDLKSQDWSYVWLDWTCMPQADRTTAGQYYFDRMLRCIPMVVRDCGFAWRFPRFEPRAWVLFEVAEYMLNHQAYWITDDIKPFVSHVNEMVELGEVKPIIEKYKYRCTTMGDMALVVGWLEMVVLLRRLVESVHHRQELFDWLNQPYTGSMSIPELGMEIDKAKGTIAVGGKTYNITPVYQITSHVSLARGEELPQPEVTPGKAPRNVAYIRGGLLSFEEDSGPHDRVE